jgi:hypothetical protein
MDEYMFLVEDDAELQRLERIMVDTVKATRFNTEGWTTAYGGKGVTVWVECSWSKRDIKQIISCFDSVSFF